MVLSLYFFAKNFGWQAINIEASPSIFKKLEENRPKAINVNVGLSSETGTSTFTDVHHPDFDLCTNGSIAHHESHLALLDQANCEYSTTEIKIMTYSDMIRALELTSVDIMVLDVEGHELDVFDGIEKGEKVLPKLLVVEIGHLGLDIVKSRLSDFGYVYDTTQDVNAFFLLKRKRYIYNLFSNIIKSIFK